MPEETRIINLGSEAQFHQQNIRVWIEQDEDFSLTHKFQNNLGSPYEKTNPDNIPDTPDGNWDCTLYDSDNIVESTSNNRSDKIAELIKTRKEKRQEEQEHLDKLEIRRRLYERQANRNEALVYQEIAEADSYDGEIPKYDEQFSLDRKYEFLYSMADTVKDSGDFRYARETSYDSIYEAAASKLEKAKKNTNLDPGLKDFKIKYYQDKMEVADCLRRAVKNCGNNNNADTKKIADTVISLLGLKFGSIQRYNAEIGKLAKILFSENINNRTIDVNQQTDTNPKLITEEQEDTNAELQRQNCMLQIFGNFHKLRHEQGQSDFAIRKEFEEVVNNLAQINGKKLSNNKQKTKEELKNELFATMREQNFTTHETQAAYLSLEQKSRINQKEQILKELENRQNKKKTDPQFSDRSEEELKKELEILEEDYKTIHELYRQVVPNLWDENSEQVLSLLFIVGVKQVQKNNPGSISSIFQGHKGLFLGQKNGNKLIGYANEWTF